MKINFFLAWYDFWVGAYFSRKNKIIYICLIPCCVITITLKKKYERTKWGEE